jgi:hypothetical protein
MDAAHTPPPPDVGDLLDRIDASWRRLHEALVDIPEDRLEEPGVTGEWSVKNLFGHIAFWDEHALRQLPRVLAGRPREEDDVQALNEADHAARRGRALPEERSAMEQAHAALVEQLATIAGAEAAVLDAAIRDDTYEHYDEHRGEIEAWRQANGI